MKIGLYFGSFNPIHIGHMIIGSYMANHTDLDQIWYIVSPQNPFKKSSTLLNEYQRLHLLQLSIGDNPKLKWSDIEFKLPKPSYTIDTLTHLHERYPHHTFSIIMGADSLQNITKWKNSDILIKKYHFYVYPRPNVIIPDNVLTGNITIVPAPLMELSSTLIRRLIKEGKSIEYLVTNEVAYEIEKNGYYRNHL